MSRLQLARALVPAATALALFASPLPSSASHGRDANARPKGYCADRGAGFRGSARVFGIYAPLDDRGPADLECTTGRIAADGIGFVRDELAWLIVEPKRGDYNFGYYDTNLEALASHHLTWLPVVEDAPKFMARRAKGRGIAPPKSPAAYAAFLKLLVRRYGPNGAFWQEHPQLPYLPVRAWQIWNEPNLTAYWLPKPSPSAYTALLRASYRAIKSVDPHATVVSAGMPFVSGVQFYASMYRDGARRYFNALAFHPYSARVRFAEQDLTLLRSVMNRAGDRHKPIWITEFGWASAGPRSPFRAGSLTPHWVSRMLAFMIHSRTLGVQRISYYDWRDPPSRPFNWWGVYMGINRANGTLRPVGRVIISTARRLDH
jgi:hypothetical protein